MRIHLTKQLFNGKINGNYIDKLFYKLKNEFISLTNTLLTVKIIGYCVKIKCIILIVIGNFVI